MPDYKPLPGVYIDIPCIRKDWDDFVEDADDELEGQQRNCSACGAPADSNAKYCSKCGTRLDAQGTPGEVFDTVAPRGNALTTARSRGSKKAKLEAAALKLERLAATERIKFSEAAGFNTKRAARHRFLANAHAEYARALRNLAKHF